MVNILQINTNHKSCMITSFCSVHKHITNSLRNSFPFQLILSLLPPWGCCTWNRLHQMLYIMQYYIIINTNYMRTVIGFILNMIIAMMITYGVFSAVHKLSWCCLRISSMYSRNHKHSLSDGRIIQKNRRGNPRHLTAVLLFLL